MAAKNKNKPIVPPSTAQNLSFIDKQSDLIFWILTAITAITALSIFNLRVDEGGDDSTYICRAMDLVAEGKYPTYQGPLYPIFLGIFVAIFGANLLILKLTSFLLILASQFIFYRTLRGNLNIRLALAVVALMSINSWYLAFASLTYSEALYIVVMYLFFSALMKYETATKPNFKGEIFASLPSGLLVVAAFLIRTIGGALGLVGVIYFCIKRQFRKAGILVLNILVFSLIWIGIRAAIWGEVKSDNQQLTSLMQKHPYQVDQGQETISGYFGRFVDNSTIYISKHLMRIAGFKDPNNRETNNAVTVIIYALFAFGTFVAFRRNRFVFFMAVTSAIMLGLTFVVLQALWEQYRLIIPYVPMSYIVILYGIYHLLKHFVGNHAHILSLILVLFSGALSLAQTSDKVDLKVLINNMKGDRLYGYTPDWYNYLNMCQKINEIVPDSAYVACRKPNMARIYADGRKFYGIYNFYTEDADELIDQLRERGVTHIIVGSLRRDPQNPGQGVINTIHRYMNFVIKKYPQTFRRVAQCGDANSEPAWLFSIDYQHVDNIRQSASETEK